MSTPTNTATGDSTHLVITTFREPVYPEQARQSQIQGQVWVHLTIDEIGGVVKAEPISGDPLLLGAAIDAMKKWKFQPYMKDGHPVRVSTKMHYDFAFKDKVVENPQISQRTINLPPTAPQNSTQSHPTEPTNVSAPAPAAGGQPTIVRVSQGVSQGLLVHQVAPVYPESARRNYVQGTVVLQAIIGKDGRIKDLKPMSAPSKELEQAAIGAVQQWRYQPYILKGQPLEVQTTINVNFKLH